MQENSGRQGNLRFMFRAGCSARHRIHTQSIPVEDELNVGLPKGAICGICTLLRSSAIFGDARKGWNQ